MILQTKMSNNRNKIYGCLLRHLLDWFISMACSAKQSNQKPKHTPVTPWKLNQPAFNTCFREPFFAVSHAIILPTPPKPQRISFANSNILREVFERWERGARKESKRTRAAVRFLGKILHSWLSSLHSVGMKASSKQTLTKGFEIKHSSVW